MARELVRKRVKVRRRKLDEPRYEEQDAKLSWVGLLGAILVGIVIAVVAVMVIGYITTLPSDQGGMARDVSVEVPPFLKFSRLQTGMTYSQVYEIMGNWGTATSEGGVYEWQDKGGTTITATFQNERLRKIQLERQ